MDETFLYTIFLFLAFAIIYLDKKGKLNLPASKKNTNFADSVLDKIFKTKSSHQIENVIEENYAINVKVESEKKSNTSKSILTKKYAALPIIWGKGKPNINDFAGLWEGRNITLEEIRKSAWEKN